MKALLLSLVILQASTAPPVLDEIKLDQATLMDVRVVEQGQPCPGHGIWMDAPTAIIQARRLKALEFERDALRSTVQTQAANAPPPKSHTWIWALVGGVVLGSAGVWLYYEQIRPQPAQPQAPAR